LHETAPHWRSACSIGGLQLPHVARGNGVARAAPFAGPHCPSAASKAGSFAARDIRRKFQKFQKFQESDQADDQEGDQDSGQASDKDGNARGNRGGQDRNEDTDTDKDRVNGRTEDGGGNGETAVRRGK
jgi:hypothetical protein